MQRITEKMLQAKVDYINKLKGFDHPKYSTVGAYCLDHAYGGVALHQYCNEYGGISDVLRCGYITKRDLFNRICAFEYGLAA